jgi:Uma2 family endonuclease
VATTTVLLGDESEPQPDLYLRILPDYGGQSRTTDDYVEGAPELVAEIAYSTRAIDLHRKLDDYRRCGVLEYIVLCLREPQVRWFDFRSGQELALDGDGVLRSRVFPGLWIDTAALVAHDHARLTTTLQAGLATPEHADFVQRLAAQRSAPRT